MESEFLKKALRRFFLSCGNRYRSGAIVRTYPERFLFEFPKEKEESRRRNGKNYLKYLIDYRKRRVYVFSTFDKDELERILNNRLPKARKEVYSLSEGMTVDFVLVRKEGDIAYLQPSPEEKKEFRAKIAGALSGWKGRSLPAMIKRINKILRAYWEKWKGLYIHISELRAIDEEVKEKLYKWAVSVRGIPEAKVRAIRPERFLFSFEKAALGARIKALALPDKKGSINAFLLLPDKEDFQIKPKKRRCVRGYIDFSENQAC